jgi:putative ABC transport system permease protein
MIKNYIKVAYRSLLGNKVSTVTQIMGLSISMVVGVLIFGMLKSNWETDHFHPFLGKTFRITTGMQSKDGHALWANCPEPLSEKLKPLSFVKKTAIVRQGGTIHASVANGRIPVQVLFTEPSFFEIFGFKISGGNTSVPDNPDGILISEETASKLFGTANPLGKAVKFDGWGTFLVEGVIEKPQMRTHLPLEVVLPLQAAAILTKRNIIPDQSGWTAFKNSSVYVLSEAENDLEQLNNTLTTYSQAVNRNQKDQYHFSAQNLEDISPWNPDIKNDVNAGMHKKAMITWILLALGLTLLAAFNYTALSVARILSRAKEVGIRKANGALKKQIFLQFIIESMMIAALALLIAYLIVFALYRSGGLGLDEEVNIVPDLYFIPILLVYTLVTGLVAGVIPSYFLSRFKPVDVLKGLKNIRFTRNISLYRIIVVIQFSITMMLMIFFVILKDATNLAKDALFSRLPDHVTIVDLKDKPASLIKPDVERLSQVQKVALSSFLPSTLPSETCRLRLEKSEKEVVIYSGFMDENFIEIFNFKTLAGNIKLKNISNKEQYVLINESAARLLSKDQANPGYLVGKTISLDSGYLEIAEIIADESFHVQEVAPAVFRFSTSEVRFMTVQGRPESEKSVTFFCKKILQDRFPDFVPDIYSYKKHMVNDFEAGSRKLSVSFGMLCAIVMFVACLGILGMANYSIQANTLQIAVRKTFGADNLQILIAVTKPFIKLLLISGIAGMPLGWLCGNLLKTRLGTHVDSGFSNLLTGYGFVFAVALVVVFSQTCRSIFISPAKVLRGE